MPAAGRHGLEAAQRRVHLRGERGDPPLVGAPGRKLRPDRIGRHLPDAVEPVEEGRDLGAPRVAGRQQRRIGMAACEWPMICSESATRRPSSTSTGKSRCPLTRSTSLRSS
jgi:hypothetical protein